MFKDPEDLLSLTSNDFPSRLHTTADTSTKEVLDRLRRIIILIQERIPVDRKKELKKVINSQGLFDNVLNQELERRNLSYERLSYLVSYLLVNQLLLYQLVRDHLVNLPELIPSEIQSLEDIKSCFEAVEGEPWDQMFTTDVISLIERKKEQEILELLKRAVVMTSKLAEMESSRHLPGILFHMTIPVEMRKILAVYYTRNEAAELLACLAIETPSTAVIDPSCGSGTLLSAARTQQCCLLEKIPPNSDFTRDPAPCGPLIGIDIMPFAVKLSSITLHLQVPSDEHQKIKLMTADATSILPEDIMEDFLPLKEHGKKNRIILMNPPFSRQENVSKITRSQEKGTINAGMPYKQGLEYAFEDYREYFNGRAGLYSFFLFVADRFLAEGDRLAAVLPVGILRLASTKGVREFLVDKYQIEFIIARADAPSFSEDTAFREILIVARKKGKCSDQPLPCHYVVIHEMPSNPLDARELAEKIKSVAATFSAETVITSPPSRLGQLEGFHSFCFTQERLVKTTGNWYTPLATGDPRLFTSWNAFLKNKKLKAWKEVLGGKQNIKRGLESSYLRGEKYWIQELSINDPRYWNNPGDKFVFTGKEGQNIIASHEEKQILIPLWAVRRAFRTFARKATYHVQELEDWVICQKNYRGVNGKERPKEERRMEQLTLNGDWVTHVEERQAKLCHLRRVDLTAPGTVFLAYHFAEPRAPGATMWTIRGITDERNLKALTIWFNSSLHLLQVILNRVETRGGFLNLHEYVLEEFRVLNVNQLKEEEKTKLAEVFEEWKEIEFPNLLEQLWKSYEGRRAIDDAVLEVLGIENREQRKKMTEELHRGLAKEIVDLKNLMRGSKGKSQKPRSREE
ncbi:MAG: Eco57I restriction-modification methylase domain-containing protein [Candidatus Odinarchaeota archaeon]